MERGAAPESLRAHVAPVPCTLHADAAEFVPNGCHYGPSNFLVRCTGVFYHHLVQGAWPPHQAATAQYLAPASRPSSGIDGGQVVDAVSICRLFSQF